MNPDTGEIREFMDKPEAEHAGFTTPLTKQQAKQLLKLPPSKRLGQHIKMNRKQRRQEAKIKRQ